MRRIVPAHLIGLILVSAVFLGGAEASAYTGWGETVGPVYATVRGTDGPGGLIVRSGPSENSPVLGRLGVGAKIRAYNQFHHGWVQVRNPVPGGWVRIDLLEPLGGEAVVTGIDRPEGCLRIRSGPSTSAAVIGCANLGETLLLTGIWSEGPWAQVGGPVPGWVYTPQIRSGLDPEAAPVRTAYARRPVRTVVATPVHYYSSAPVWTGPYYRYGKYPYKKYPRRVRYYGEPKVWKYPYKKYGYRVHQKNVYKPWKRSYKKHYRNRGYPRQYGAGRYGKGKWAVQVGPRGGVRVRAGRVGFGVGPRGQFYVRGRR